LSINLEGLTPSRNLRLGGQVDWDDPVAVPNGLAISCQNMAFLAETVKTRWGLRVATQLLGLMADPTGVDVLTVLGSVSPSQIQQQAGGATRSPHSMLRVRNFPGILFPSTAIPANTQVAVVFTSAGELLLELPAGTGSLVAITNTRIAQSLINLLATFSTTAAMQTTKAYNRIYMAFSDLKASMGPVLALDAATGMVSVVPQNAIAAIWQANTFYNQGDIVTPTANPNVWFRRTQTGFSSANEPAWPAGSPPLGYFTVGYVANYAQAADGTVADAWEEWTPGFPAFLPAPSPIASGTASAGGTLPAGDDIYVCLSYFNDLGESLWTQPFVFYNQNANQELTCNFSVVASGPPMPRWLMSVMNQGTSSAGLHWPAAACLNVYVAAVAHNAAAPTAYYLYGTARADQPVVITAVPGSGSTYSARMSPTAQITTEQFMGEGGLRYAVLLRQNTMGDLSPVDPQGALPVNFPSALTEDNVQISVSGDSTKMYVVLDDVTQWAPGSQIQISACSANTTPSWNGTYTVQSVILGEAQYGYAGTTLPNPFPGGTLVIDIAGLGFGPVEVNPAVLPFTAVGATLAPAADGNPYPEGATVINISVTSSTGYGLTPGCSLDIGGDSTNYSVTSTVPVVGNELQNVQISPGLSEQHYPGLVISLTVPSVPTCSISASNCACPVAVVPPGVQEGPGYSYDILAFTVVGIGASGPFTYLAQSNPLTAFSTQVLLEITDGDGNAYAQLESVAGLAPGNSVMLAGWTGANTPYNGLRVLAGVNGTGANTVTFPDGNPALSASPAGVTMTLVQSLPTQVAAGTVGIVLQFDDTTLPQGVDVTDNLLYIAIPDAIDLCYLPSIDRVAYVSDSQPTTIIFSESSYLGELDGENDVLSVEQSDGAKLAGVRELLNGMIIACKESGGYQIVPSADVPARWGQNRVWGNHGPWSGRNIATGRDAGSKLSYLIFVDPESGVYRWPPVLGQGDLDWLSKELSGANNQDASRKATWDRVNRAAGEQIQVVIDDIAKEIKIALPLDGATTPNYVATMSYFNGWQDPLMLTLSGEWVANRMSRRWNLDPIPTRSMALVKRILATPVDQRVNRRQLLLGVPSMLPTSVVSAQTSTQNVAAQPTLANGNYYVQIAKVTGGVETAWSPVYGPFTVLATQNGAQWSLESVQINLPGDELEDSWNLYFGTAVNTLTSKVNIPNNVSTYFLSASGAVAVQPTGSVQLEYMQPGAYDDLGAGYVAKYRPAYTKEPPSQLWPAGGRICRFSAVTGHALGRGMMSITSITPNPNYQPDPLLQTLDEGEVEAPGSAPITHFARGEKGDSEFLTCEFSNQGVPGAWFQLVEVVQWFKPLFPTR
jgi:hypothetical protein